MQKIAFSIALGFAAAAVGGCASMQKGAFEKIEITSSPSGAHCKIYRDGRGYVKSVSTPGSKYIQRDQTPITIVCSKEGYQTTSVTHTPEDVSTDEAALGNFASLGLGFFIDETASARKDLPERFEITLPKQN